MTYQVTALVQAQTYAAMRTFGQFSTFFALKHRRPCASRAQDHDLSTLCQSLSYVLDQFAGEVSFHSFLAALGFGVDDLHIRVSRSVVSLFQLHHDMLPAFAVICLFK